MHILISKIFLSILATHPLTLLISIRHFTGAYFQQDSSSFKRGKYECVHNLTGHISALILLKLSISSMYIIQVAMTKLLSKSMLQSPGKKQWHKLILYYSSLRIIDHLFRKKTWRTLRNIKLRSFPMTRDTCWQSEPSLLVKSPTVSESKKDISYNRFTNKVNQFYAMIIQTGISCLEIQMETY